MRWNCPHCQVGLEASDDQISANWSFSLCPKCMRFGLVRASSQTAVKVDRAPQGERFVRASVTELVPIVKPAQQRSRSGTNTAIISPAPKSAPATVSVPVSVSATAAVSGPVTAPATGALPKIKLPEPLPEVPENRTPFFPKIILASCLVLLAWNGYRYWAITQDAPPARVPEISDRVVSKAMAPERIELGSHVRARGDGMQIHNGPGIQYPVIGVLDLNQNYKVVSMDDQWYQVQIGAPSPAWVLADEISPAN